MPTTLVHKLIQSITWTLVHSLWQGLILTVFAGLVLLLTRRTTAALRYALLCTIFFLFLGGVCLTFLVEWNRETEPVQKLTVLEQASSYSIFSFDHWRKQAAFFLDQHSQWIVLSWIIVLLFQSTRMMREMVYIRELRNRTTQSSEPFWTVKVQASAKELGIRKTVSLVQSAVVKIPVVIGHFKPLVIVPIGMLNHLSPVEAEAVLLHELAHIRRHDYLVNYLQRIAETLLFFNPGLLWVSSLLRAEREACCDEMAIARTGSKLQFVEALISCKEHALHTPAFSLGLFGNRNVLLHRLNRIVSNRNRSLSLFEGSFLGLSILMLTIIMTGWSEESKSSTTLVAAPTATQAVPANEAVEQASVEGDQNENKQKEMTVKLKRSTSFNRRSTQPKRQQTRDIAHNINESNQQVNDLSNGALPIVAEIDNNLLTKHDAQREKIEKLRAQADWDRLQVEKARQQAEIDRAQAEEHRQQANRERQLANEYREQAQRDRLRADRDRIEVQRLRDQTNRYRQPEVVQ